MTRTFESQAEQAAYELGLQDASEDQPEKLTLLQIKEMTPEEVAGRLDEVNEVIANG